MIKNFDVQHFGLNEIETDESIKLNGGVWNFIGGYIVGKLIDIAIDDFSKTMTQAGKNFGKNPPPDPHRHHPACDNV